MIKNRNRKHIFGQFFFFFGASNDNLEEVLKIDFKTCPGLKIFMGSSTGNMLVDDFTTLNNIFSKCEGLVATHCEDEETIKKNISKAKVKFGQNIPFDQHPIIRSREACFKSSDLAVSLAKKYNTRFSSTFDYGGIRFIYKSNF